MSKLDQLGSDTNWFRAGIFQKFPHRLGGRVWRPSR